MGKRATAVLEPLADGPAPPPTPPPAPDTPPDSNAASPATDQTTSGMVCFLLDDATAKALSAAFPAPDGAQGPEIPHVTLNFLGPDVTQLDQDSVVSAVTAAVAAYSAAGQDESTTISGVFNGLARFAAEPDSGLTPIVATLDAPELEELQVFICEALDQVAGVPDPTHGFVAHSTIARIKLGDTDPVSLGPPPMTQVSFTEVAVVWGDSSDPANITKIPLTASDSGPAIEAPEGEPTDDGTGMGFVRREAWLRAHSFAVADAPTAPAPNGEGRTDPVAGPLGTFEACLVTEGIPTDEVFPGEGGDEDDTVMGRLIPPGTLTWRTPPIPVGVAVTDDGTFTPADTGHTGAPIGGAITQVSREGDRIMGRGPYLDNPAGRALKAAADQGAPIGPSIDLGASDQWDIAVNADGTTSMTLLSGSIAGIVVLPYEAQHSAPDGTWLTWFHSVPGSEALTWFHSVPGSEAPEGGAAEPADIGLASGTTVLLPAVAASGVTAGVTACGEGLFGAPLYPSRDWFFTIPPGEFTGPTVTDEGQVFGHAAGKTCHIGFPGTCLRIADGDLSRDFSLFHKGVDDKARGIKTAEGELVQVGQVTLWGGHADISLSADAAKRHYDDTHSMFANVRMIWDPVVAAPWMAGAVAPGVTEAQVQTFRAAGEVSVDYRRLEDGKLHLVALPVVPRGGWPPLRALSAGGELRTLILSESPEASMEVIGAVDLPIAPRDTAWDGGAAQANMADMCGGIGSLDTACFGRGFLWRDPDGDPGNVTSYKLPFADRINGRLQAVFRGISAVAGRLDQSDIPAADKGRIKGKISAYYDRFRKEFNDDTIAPPWGFTAQAALERETAVAASAVLLDLAHDLYAHRFADAVAGLSDLHRLEIQRLGGRIG